MAQVELSQGTIHYRDVGDGPIVVPIHGILVNGSVWGPLVKRLSQHTRCVVPDLPLGSHPVPVKRGADLSPPGLAALIAEFLERLDLDEVTLVGNDTGGALCQLVCAHHSDRVARLVLTNCDAFENFPPKSLRPAVKALARVPGLVAELGLLGQFRPVRRASMSLMPLTVDPVPDELVKEWVGPLTAHGVRRDLIRVARGIDPKHTIAAAERLRAFNRPALIVWGLQDRFFSVQDAERLVQTLPAARLERLHDARTFVQLDLPDRLAELVEEFVRVPQPTP